MIVQSTGKDNKASISFTVLKSELTRALELGEELKNQLDATGLESKEDISNLYDVKASILNLENKIIQLEFFLGMTDPTSCDNPANAGRMDCK